MTEPAARWLLVLLLLSAACAELPPAAARSTASTLHVTSGAISRGADGVFSIQDGSVRAELSGQSDVAELRFVYRGPSVSVQPLASGELRRQIGIKLRARDSCNVVYVMWQIEPKPGLEVSVKSNPALHTHAECRDHGYQFVRADSARGMPRIAPDAWHVLRAELHGLRLRVAADGTEVWQGTLPDTVSSLEGPAGLRADNGRFELYLRVP